MPSSLPKYDRCQTYDWNYEHAPDPVEIDVPEVPGEWRFCGLPVDSPLGVPAGPLLNGRWCLYYASLGFDVLTYKTVRSRARACYPLPNLQPVQCEQLSGGETEVAASDSMHGSWAVSYGMPSKTPDVWRADVEATRRALPPGKLLSVSVVATVQPEWTLDDLADDYSRCARWAMESGADVVETNFSCPNVTTCDGQLYQQPDDARRVAERVREAIGNTPYVVKIGHVANREAAAELLNAIAPKIDAIAMTNSVATNVRAGDSLLFDGQRRGICGEAIRDASLGQVRVVAELIRERGHATQIIGVGGIGNAEDVTRYLDAGAHACHLATSAMLDPAVAIRIKRDLAKR
jgi:dihydroorotate dehydrogenase